MKLIKLVFVMLGLLFPIVNSAQKKPRIKDKQLRNINRTINAQLIVLSGSRVPMGTAYLNLRDKEKKYADKIDVTSTLGASPVLLGAQYQAVQTNTLIAKLESKIKILENTPPFIHFGLKQIKEDLDVEKGYLAQVENNLDPITTGLALQSGGVGYSYTFWLKLYLRAKRIRSRIQQIEYRLDNLNTFIKVFH
ncbi:MAG: hypothetical protein AAFZ89_07155 [Bacteroidota bacterium]